MPLTIKDWQKHQHFVRRRPTWIKLHHEVLNDRRFIRLPVASRALLPVLWLLASEYDAGAIPLGIGDIAFRLHWSEEAFTEAIRPCIDVGFVRWPEFGAPDCENADDLFPPASNGNHSINGANLNNLKQSKATDDSESESESEGEREKSLTDHRVPTTSKNLTGHSAYGASNKRSANGKARERKEKNGSRISEAWKPDTDERAFAVAIGIVDVDKAAAEFVDYWRGIPGQRGRKSDWPATWRNRCRQIVERRPAGGGGRPQRESIDEKAARAIKRSKEVHGR